MIRSTVWQRVHRASASAHPRRTSTGASGGASRRRVSCSNRKHAEIDATARRPSTMPVLLVVMRSLCDPIGDQLEIFVVEKLGTVVRHPRAERRSRAHLLEQD